MKTKQNYIAYLNEVGKSLSPDEFIMAGKMRRGLYGNLLQKYDPIAFEVGFNEWKRR